jgi:hypothetical protein
MPRRETWVQEPPANSGPVGEVTGPTLATLLALCGTGLSTEAWRKLAVV